MMIKRIEQIDEQNSRFMIARLFILLLAAPLGAAPTMATLELKSSVDELAFKLHGQEVELGLLLERLNSLEKQKPVLPGESRVVALEKSQKAFASDLQTLKQNLESSNKALVECQKKLSEIDSKLTKEIQSLKTSLHSMLAILNDEPENFYIVQPGDSLGQIALDQKLTIKKLKELNSLTKDTIIVGQKLRLK